MVAKTLQNKRSLPGKFSAIPHKTGSDQVMDAVASNLEQLTGMRGAGGKKAVLWEDLKGLGIAELRDGRSKTLIDFKRLARGAGGSGNGGTTTGGGDVVESPTQPQNLVVRAGFGVVTLTWDTAPYKGHAYTEIFQATEDNYSKAVRIDTTPSSIDSLPLPQKGDFYYWIKFVNEKGEASALNATHGIHAKSAVDPQFYLDLISGQLRLHPEQLGLSAEDLGIDLSKYATAEVVDQLDVLLAEAALENSLTTDEQTTARRIENKTLTATIKRDYYTAVTTDNAIATAVQKLKASIEDPNGKSVMATLTTQYATKATVTKSITSLTNKLSSDIGKVNSTLKNDYATNTTLTNAISQAKTSLQSNINSLSGTLTTDYKTWADTSKVISQLRTSLTSAINNGGTANANLKNTVTQLKATLQQDYATKTSQGSAISNLKTTLTSAINSSKSDSTKALNLVKSDLTQNYATKTSQSSAISSLRTSLSSSLKKDIKTAASGAVADAKKETTKQVTSLSSNIAQSYVTKTSQGTALSNLSTTLTSSISKAAKSETTKQVATLKATLKNDYFTKVQTRTAISQSQSTLQSSLNGVTSRVSTLQQSISSLDTGYSALWGVKATVGDLHSSVGLVARSSKDKSTANAYFTVKDADFRVIYTKNPKTSEKKVVPIFATIDEVDNHGNKTGGKVLVIDSAYINNAYIKNLVVKSGAIETIITHELIHTPKLKTPIINEPGAKFYVDNTGHVEMRDYKAYAGRLKDRLSLDGGSYVDGRATQHFLYSRGGAFYVNHDGYLHATKGKFEGDLNASKVRSALGGLSHPFTASGHISKYKQSCSWRIPTGYKAYIGSVGVNINGGTHSGNTTVTIRHGGTVVGSMTMSLAVVGRKSIGGEKLSNTTPIYGAVGTIPIATSSGGTLTATTNDSNHKIEAVSMMAGTMFQL